MTSLSPDARRIAIRLLRAIHEKTGGRGRAVRDVRELETGLTPEQSTAAWQALLDYGLIERFSLNYAARMSFRGIDFLAGEPLESPPVPERSGPRTVFIVRGEDSGARGAVAEYVANLDLLPVLLQEPAIQGKTLMQQVEAHGEEGFAVLLLSPDDLGFNPATAEIRPPLNVLLELGYLLGRLGSARVCAFASSKFAQLPSDLAGVALEPFDDGEGWKRTLRRGLEAAGFRVEPA